MRNGKTLEPTTKQQKEPPKIMIMTWSSTAKAFKTVMLKESAQFQKEMLDGEKDKQSKELLKDSFKREQAKIKAINAKTLKHFMQKHGVRNPEDFFKIFSFVGSILAIGQESYRPQKHLRSFNFYGKPIINDCPIDYKIIDQIKKLATTQTER